MTKAERTGVFLCRCGTNISDTVDIDVLAEHARRLDGVATVRDCRFLCADSGQRMIQEDVAENELSRVVVAACSPLMHEQTFRNACQRAGLNPFNLQMANIREQVSWVTPDRAQATNNSLAVVSAAVRRVQLHQPLHVKKLPVAQRVMVVGAGITGIETALSLARAGKKVILVEREPSIGGHMTMLAKTFPTLDCSACIIVPKMAHAADHPNIDLLSYSEVVGVSGTGGSYVVTVRKKARYVDSASCNGCGLCAEVCPWSDIPSEFDQGLGVRSAIYFPFPQAVPHLPVVDADHCAHFQSSTCSVCQNSCPTGAIRFDQEDELVEFEVGAITLATGFELFDPSAIIEYGYRRWDNILTSLQFERLCHPSGPTDGRIVMKNGREPESIAILHCVGSRDHRFNRHCSRICCLTALKFAMMAGRQTGARVFSFFIDMRVFGKGCEEFYEQAQRAGVVFIHGKGTEVIHRDGKLIVKAEDSALGRRVMVPVDMVVLAVGAEPRHDAKEVARLFGIGCTESGFFMEKHLKFAPMETATEGIYIAGACQGPKDIPESVAQGAAAAAHVLGLLEHGTIDIVPTVAVVNHALCGNCGLCLRDCPFEALQRTERDGRTVVAVNEVLCESCGSCAATCPTGAITQLGYTRQQLFAEIEGLVGERGSPPT